MNWLLNGQVLRKGETEMSSRNIKTIPSHGDPLKPSLQTQEKEPSEFTQSAPTSQGSVSWLHSSISSKEK